MLRALVLHAIVLTGCTSELPTVRCGPGTMLVGDACVPIDDPPLGDDAGATRDTSDGGTAIDSGSQWSTGGSSEPGCEGAECDAWEAELAAMLGSGCEPLGIDPAVQPIAEEHSRYQAQIDRVAGEGPDGTVFDRLRERDVSYREAAALFSVTRTGPADVVARWRDRSDTAAILDACYTHGGVSFQTSASGASYATVVLLVR